MPKTVLAVLTLVASAAMPALATAVTPVPEPATMLLVGGGLAATILIARKRRK